MLLRSCTLTVPITRRSCRTLLPTISVLFILLRTTTSMLNAIGVLCASIADDNFSKADLISIVNVESVDRVSESLNWVKLVARRFEL